MSSPAVAASWKVRNGSVAARPLPGLSVRVERSFDDVASAWHALEREAGGSPYGRLAWAEAWHATIGRAEQVEPCIVVGSDRGGAAVLLPLALRRRGPLTSAEFLGGKDSNGNLGLFADPQAWTAESVRALLAAAAKAAGIDLYVLRNQPADWIEGGNPLLLLPCQPSPSDGMGGTLLPGTETTLHAKLSKHARKMLRQKENRLRAERPLEHRVATTPEAVDTCVAAYMRLRAARARETGLPPPPTGLADFLRCGAAAGDHGEPALEVHALHWGEEIVAILGGATKGGRFSGMVIAFESRREVARNSPGELLVAAAVADLSRRGFSRFDLGIGEARYKASFCDTPDPMFDSFVGITRSGRALATALSFAARAKRGVKRSRVLWPAAVRLRAGWSRVSRW